MDSFEENIKINAPVEVCYWLWHDFEKQPSFLPCVQSVRHLDGNMWRYVMLGPHGDAGIWDGLIVKDIPNKLISWRSTDGPDLEMGLDFSFLGLDIDHTLLSIKVAVEAPVSPIGKVIENLYALSRNVVDQNLEAFKDYAEEFYEGSFSWSERGKPAGFREQSSSLESTAFLVNKEEPFR